MSQPLLSVRNLSIAVEDRVICQDISFDIFPGECHILVGPNGSGKSTLLCGLMGISPFKIVEGTVTLQGVDIHELDVDERARLGMGLAFQRPPAIEGVTVRRLAHAIGAHDRLDQVADLLSIGYLVDRDINSGFSGGETKRWEVAKLALHDASMCLFDEPESGVDLEHVGVVSQAINQLLETPTSSGQQRAVLAITHTGFILDQVNATRAHLMIDGRIVHSADPHELFDRIRRVGYQSASVNE
ncbi:MAG: ATP-binding cassette domain-containing protein [Corynebacterium sp.]|uniref:ABC transporter ATP-binding protein n=1 Tax=Corynebacterium sp. TaxID=1720 RepID=UPI0026DC4E28|nr:ATP-binding cassette domain-containing protein [Corynebacterium sp.]MDO4760486.1 ATP-binding cassette domain-containing protein [Corynebacterium sp.]